MPAAGPLGLLSAALLAAAVLAAACSSSGADAHLPPPRSTIPAPTVAASVPAPTTTTSTTVDPGSLPQTSELPAADDPAFLARVADLWQAIETGDPSVAAPAFFPLAAYIQVKGISDPVHDYQTRLIPDFDSDIAALHTQIGTGAAFVSVTVPHTAQWILPGVEYNKGSYWRVYDTRVNYTADGVSRSFPIASMISWRGEWYVVHLSSIR